MTPKEKAQELIDKFADCTTQSHMEDKECALIAVNEIIEATKQVIERPDYYGVVLNPYWQQVRKEIESL